MIAVLAIDGPAGSGKSTVARAVAERLGFPVLDTGAMYRAVTAEVLARGVAFDDVAAIVEIARTAALEVGTRVVINRRDVTELIRTPEIDVAVSPVARLTEVRAVLIPQQRAWGESQRGGVVEGRDMGAVVFPDARLKVFLTASEEERARRRLLDHSSTGVSATEVEAALHQRDRADVPSTLEPAPGAVVVDTTGLSLDEVVERVIALWHASDELP